MKFVIENLMKYVGHEINTKQFRGVRKTGTSHYLVELISFILYNLGNLDNLESHAVIATTVDFSIVILS